MSTVAQPGRARAADLLAAAVVAALLLPQALAYAVLAGLPAQSGIWAALAGGLLYAWRGGSAALSVGPVAVLAWMTAAALEGVTDPTARLQGAMWLALLAGAAMLLFGRLRLGWLADLLSGPVILGFVAACAVLIGLGQLGVLFGMPLRGGDLPALLGELAARGGAVEPRALAAGGSALLVLLGLRAWRGAGSGLRAAAPLAALLCGTLVAWAVGPAPGDAVGALPLAVVPPAPMSPGELAPYVGPAVLIALVAYLESMAVARALAGGRRIDPDREWTALGAANLGAGLVGGFPVAGGFARSAVSRAAGAASPAAGAYAALLVLILAAAAAPLLAAVPRSALAAVVLVALGGLVEPDAWRRLWRHRREEAAVAVLSGLATLILGVERGLSAGLLGALGLLLARSARPHVAVLGRVPGTERFLNVARHRLETVPGLLLLRVDESLHFLNVRRVENALLRALEAQGDARHLVLVCAAVNDIDHTAAETLASLAVLLEQRGITLHFAEIKGPVRDSLARSPLAEYLAGHAFDTTWAAWCALAGARSGGR
ncbi:MAG: sodium-independent anion transporter [Gammaproteobacteria bacterium]|nr:MAG: sodium-independent anion transporter [Gammaproteobacteria bacterium]